MFGGRRRHPCLVALLLSGVAALGACDASPEPVFEDSTAGGIASAAPGLDRAEALMDERRYEDAERIFATLRGSGDEAARWRALYGWARARLTRGFHADAQQALGELRTLSAEDPVRRSRVERLSAAILHREGNLDGAEGASKEAIEWARRASDLETEAEAQSMLATVYSLSGRHAEALGIDERLVELRRNVAPGSRDLALALNEIGIDYRHFGRFGDAIAAYDEALALYEAHEDPEGQAMVLYNLASIYTDIGDVKRALDLKLQSLDFAEEVGHSYGLGLLNKEIGTTYLDAGNLSAARTYLERALEINRSAHQAYGELLALESLGRLDLELGRPESSRDRLAQALKLAEEGGYAPQAAAIRLSLSRAAVEEGRLADALELADEALRGTGQSSDPEARFRALEAKAVALHPAGRAGEGAAVALEAIELLESWRGRLALGDLRMGVTHPRSSVFELAVRCLFEQGQIAAAFEVGERGRARWLLDLMAERDRQSAAGRLRARLSERFAAWQRAKPQQKEDLDQEIETLLQEWTALEDALRRDEPTLAAARFPRPVSVAEIQQVVLAPGRALVAYLWGERDVFGWWIEKNAVRGARLGTPQELGPLVEFLRATIRTPHSPADWRVAAGRAFERLVLPLRPSSASEVVILPDGPLALLPFEVLGGGDAGRPWVSERRIAYAPSASLLAATARAGPRPRPPRAVLALGYSPATADTTRTSAAMVTRETLSPIPEAPGEARFVYELFRERDSLLLEGEVATRERWLGSRPGEFRYIHFATHAVVSPHRPEQSHLLLARGRLDVTAIRQLQLNADLVTLSACETALGRRARGEGVVGLAHAFMAAGARGVLVSLWRVDDRRAAEFMRRFYTALREGRTPPEALFAVRKSWLESGQVHPSVWASFVLVGSARDAVTNGAQG